MNENKSNPMWGGRFTSSPSEIMQKINSSISFDKRLAHQDIQASRAHCSMLVSCKIINSEDGTKILNGLDQIEGEIASGSFQFKTDLEDIHMNIENRLAQIIGAPAGKLHTARSRNDQVVTDFKLWVRDSIDQTSDSLLSLQKALVAQATVHTGTIMPGYTHLQAAQPITLGHHLMAYCEMFGRDRSRFADARRRMNECPLGVAALAGTTFPIDRNQTSEGLGFDRPTGNSLDTVSDRDFALDYLAAASISAIHLSRFAEEMILWCSPQFRFITLPDAFTTGSSIMPQKKNPDAAELIRAKTGRIIGDLTSLLVVMKGLPLAYSKDMQEDKEPVFDAHDSLNLGLCAMQGMISEMQVHSENMLQAARIGFPEATDLADWLVCQLNIPFRNAHAISAKIVQKAEDHGCDLKGLDLSVMKTVEPRIHEGILEILSIDSCVNRRKSHGGTAPESVRKQINQFNLANK
ncbi:MAG: argininosuccinate lyase [Candidatus Riflebacteria bacterium]|nr:argininosuccinate lyase [Candidatus Riflebacteria bacterium]